MILGIDEAGRGPWAGPLVVGAVVLGGAEIEGLTDSKKLTKKKREALYDEITKKALAYASGWVGAKELDGIGMSAALRLATRRAVEQIKAPYTEIIIDGTVNFLADTGKGRYVQTMPKADLLVPSVSAASIIAKVERDWYMTRLGEKYPDYGFGSHAGYGVAKHREAIERLGVTPEHRLSFAPLQKYAEMSDSSVPHISQVPVSVRESRDTSRESRTAQPERIRTSEMAGANEPTLARVARGGAAPNSNLRELGASRAAGPESSDLRSEAYDGSGVGGLKTTKSIGDRAENVVAEYLRREGHEILERNWRTKFCEIDIVSQLGDTVYFTEVKYRKNANQGGGMAAITAKKLRQMKFAAEYYALKNSQQSDLRLAAASVVGDDELESWITLD